MHLHTGAGAVSVGAFFLPKSAAVKPMLISPFGSRAIHSSFSTFSVKSFNFTVTDPTFFLLKEISVREYFIIICGYKLKWI
jgi:hypothetical protein